MAAGDLITRATQYEFGGLLLGSGTPYIVESMEGLDSMPELRSDDEDRQDDHGAIPGIDLLPGRTIEATLNVNDVSHAAIMARYRDMARVMSPSRVEIPLVFRRPGEDRKQVFARPRRRNFPSNYDVAHGLAIGSLQWFAPDPRIYSLIERSAQVVLAGDVANADGTVTPGARSGSVVVNNAGDFRTFPRFRIEGDGTNPRIAVSNQTPAPDGTSYNGRTFAIDYDMAAADRFDIDSKRKTIALNGANSYRFRRTDSRWWELMPGTQTVTFSRSDTTGTQTYTVYWYDAWI